tara:strand:+ start:1029 stop:1853 length:825 start_codon:yes stop_codon:yes gene_type:complete
MESKVNFYHVSSYVKSNNLDHYKILEQAYEKKMFASQDNELLKNFINHFRNINEIKSQLYQDVFASFIIEGNFDKTFLEFGATNGIDLSNTYILEKNMAWNGFLSEPSPQWHKDLENNRPKNNIITKCIWSKTGESLEFFVSDVGVLSTINEFKESDKLSMPGNTRERIKSGSTIKVNTISLNDVVKNLFNSQSPSYISIDTEGSEYEILRYFDFRKYRPKVFTIEHNHTDLQSKIDELLISNDYVRVFSEITAFDAWYISKEAYNLVKKKLKL